MSDELEIFSDGEGLAVIGDAAVVDRFLSSAGVPSKDLQLQKRLGSAMKSGSGLAQTGSQVAAESGRWIKLTEDSAKALKISRTMTGSSDGVARTILTDPKGKITKILEFTKPGSVGSMLTNPAMLAGAAGIMAQLAMEQTMEEITEYLEVIDEKVDDILLAQKNAEIAQMIGVGRVIDDAIHKREHVGRVSEVTWSNLHGAAQTIATTQAYALLMLDGIAKKMETKSAVGDLAKIASAAETTVEEWLAVIARCFQLQDGLDILELDRVLDSSPDDVDRHRAALKAARAKRRDDISAVTSRLLSRMDAAVTGANEKVLFNPLKAGRVVRSGNEVANDVVVFHQKLGIDGDRAAIEARSWRSAAGEVRDGAVGATERGVKAIGRFGSKAVDGAKSGTGRLLVGAGERLQRREKDDASPEPDSAPEGPAPDQAE
ncbi:hypothetical protein [Parenemella sanctibonifatiensis]|uniref:Uncharacterized protein n=1 Tax=Parenemella sanctibonifatiensis TaxID=2016505 RepID=A0A255E3T4_9ACTN|nr:hypothetical protein [Parenemella sanctibonifatiensis]OYN84032.1 hypothetical protein CGZ92_13310 [Parenemella sanctibonifatiensis]